MAIFFFRPCLCCNTHCDLRDTLTTWTVVVGLPLTVVQSVPPRIRNTANMPQNWEEFKAERPSWKDFKSARRRSTAVEEKPTWAEFRELPDENAEWVQYWNGIVAAQGSEPSAATKVKRMAKWFKKHIDESFDVNKAVSDFKHQNDSVRSMSTEDVRPRVGNNSHTSESSSSGSTASRPPPQSTTERFASWGRNHTAAEPPTASENVSQSLSPLIELSHYAKREPFMVSRSLMFDFFQRRTYHLLHIYLVVSFGCLEAKGKGFVV